MGIKPRLTKQMGPHGLAGLSCISNAEMRVRIPTRFGLSVGVLPLRQIHDLVVTMVKTQCFSQIFSVLRLKFKPFLFDVGRVNSLVCSFL